MSHKSETVNFVRRLIKRTSPNFNAKEGVEEEYIAALDRYKFTEENWDVVLETLCTEDFKGIPALPVIYVIANQVEAKIWNENREARGKIVFDLNGVDMEAIIILRNGQWVMADGHFTGQNAAKAVKLMGGKFGKRLFGGGHDTKYIFPDKEERPRPEEILAEDSPEVREIMRPYNIRMGKWSACQKEYGVRAHDMWDSERGCEKEDDEGWDTYSQPGGKSSGEAPQSTNASEHMSYYTSTLTNATASSTTQAMNTRQAEDNDAYWDSLLKSGKQF